jgi:hypothetical protein
MRRILGHHVADAAQCAYGVGAELAAQMVDIDLDRVAADLLAPGVEVLFQLRARQGASGLLHQRQQQGVLPGGKLNGFAGAAHGARGRVERDPGCGEHRRRLAAGSPQQGAQAGVEFAEVEGLHQVVVGPGIETPDAVVDGIAGGQDQHR